jgi:hypothetical protein
MKIKKPIILQTQRVVLLYGDFTYNNGDSVIVFTHENKNLEIPVDAIISGATLFGDSKKSIFQGSILLNEKSVPQIRDFLKQGNNLSVGNLVHKFWGINPPPCPQGTGQPECPPKTGIVAHFLDINLQSPVEAFSLPNIQSK